MRRGGSSLVLLLILAPSLPAQGTVVCRCPAMPVLRLGAGSWQAQVEVSVAVVTMTGEVLTFQEFTIPATPVRGVLRRSVDPCVCSGRSEDGSVMTLQLPREPVVLRRGVPTALAMTATGTLTRPDGRVHQVSLRYPDCPTRRTGRGQRLANAITATGTVSPQQP